MFANAFVCSFDLLWLSAFRYYTVLFSELTLVDVDSTIITTHVSVLTSDAVFKADFSSSSCICVCVYICM